VADLLASVTESTKPIFTKFSGLVELWESLIIRSFILHSLKVIAMTTNFRGKIGEIVRPTLIRRHGIPKMVKISECR